ncbi:hypothetical protein M569_13049 [Genlisea aurea]|uniref:Uncharacterized protein n=1 Tax=Genlisea aurea TaxID=192259 RepID=S8C4D4_9LAMI|nr:hypothetical protein M569_13049 [Genlisea aurea]
MAVLNRLHATILLLAIPSLGVVVIRSQELNASTNGSPDFQINCGGNCPCGTLCNNPPPPPPPNAPTNGSPPPPSWPGGWYPPSPPYAIVTGPPGDLYPLAPFGSGSKISNRRWITIFAAMAMIIFR